MKQMLADLEALSNAIGVSGFEDSVRKIIHERVRPHADEVRVDPLGNLLVTKKGMRERPRIIVDAHMDELGFIASHVDCNGFIRFEDIGGWDDRTLPGQPVRFETEKGAVEGLIGMKPPHLQKADEKERTIRSEDMFVDVGASSAEQVAELGIGIGSPFTIYHAFRVASYDRLMGKAFDDRAGCALLIDVLRRLRDIDHNATIVFVFSVCEEVGGRGAITAGYAVDADIGLAVETTAAGDIPGVPAERCATSIEKGPAITVADRSHIAHPAVVSKLKEAAAAAGIRYQIKKPLYGGTDAAKLAIARGGVPSGVLSIPCRYIHNGISLLSPSDLTACADMALSFCTLAESVRQDV